MANYKLLFFKKQLTFWVMFFLLLSGFAQKTNITGVVKSEGKPLAFVNVVLPNLGKAAHTNEQGLFVLNDVPFGNHKLNAQLLGYKTHSEIVKVDSAMFDLNISLVVSNEAIEEVVVSGTLKPMSKSDSPVPVEVYSQEFFQKNPTASVFDALANVNGVRPQLNCNVCNTGDIHINGLEGPYTMILIDGMPIVSGLSTVYGLMGIPQSLIDRVEIVKGPASTLYGSEAVGGIINVITKSPSDAPLFTGDIYGNSWGEVNTDLGIRFNAGGKAHSLLGVNYFNYNNPIDNNGDGITDLTLQNRLSVFNKWSFKRKKNRVFTLAGRYMYEDRWGGEMNWSSEFRGGDAIYGESIYTSRWEAFGVYQLPTTEKIDFSFSANGHDQNSVYGDMVYIGDQKIAFGQLTWFKTLKSHDFTVGAAYRYTYYDDNTTATSNGADEIHLPGVFFQDQIKLSATSTLLLGGRYDYNSAHGNVFSPRANYKWQSKNKKNTLRLTGGNGFRVVNLFTEDHAAISGTREVVIEEELAPETSWNGNVNYVRKFLLKNNAFLSLDFSGFYTYFTNQILPDYDSDADAIIYSNLDGYAVSHGVSLNTDFSMPNGLNILAGVTLMDVSVTDDGVTERQELTEQFTATWGVTYKWKKKGLRFDYTGNVYGPMVLPVLENDTRAAESPFWSIQNIQVTKIFKKGWEIYAGVQNLLNYTIPVNSMWATAQGDLVRRADGTVDPFNESNQFDPAYIFAPNQGVRGNLGIRYTIK